MERYNNWLEANRITKRLKTRGVDLDKRAKDRKAEHDRLKKQYAKEDSALEEAKIEVGSEVRFKPKFAESPAEAKLVFIVLDLRGPRVLISPRDWKRGIAPSESVLMNTIELIK
jgi:hypothetical protein